MRQIDRLESRVKFLERQLAILEQFARMYFEELTKKAVKKQGDGKT